MTSQRNNNKYRKYVYSYRSRLLASHNVIIISTVYVTSQRNNNKYSVCDFSK